MLPLSPSATLRRPSGVVGVAPGAPVLVRPATEAATVTFGQGSSSSMRMVASDRALTMIASPVALLRATLKSSSLSRPLSLLIDTVTVFRVWPGANVRVPEAAA